MNREIKFRGQDLYKNWIYGYYTHSIFGHYITTKDCNGFLEQQEIYPETLQQFTGVYDDNGSEIFENDIIRIYNSVSYDEDGTSIIGDEYKEDVIIFQDGGFKLENGEYLHEIDRAFTKICIINDIHYQDNQLLPIDNKVKQLCDNFEKNRNSTYPKFIETTFVDFAKECVQIPFEKYYCSYNFKTNELEITFTYKSKKYKITEASNNNSSNYTLYQLKNNLIIYIISSNNIIKLKQKLEE